jgi:hypothetical protein
MKEFDQRLDVERKRRLEELCKEYVENRKQDWRREKKLQQQRKQDAKQREREEEIDRRLQAEKETTHLVSTPGGNRRSGSSH